MARWVNLDDCIEISAGEMRFYPVELLGDVYEEVAPVIHAHWIVDARGSYGVRNCSNCGGYGNDTHTHYGRTHGDVDGFRIKPLPYCPHCGAKMDEEVGKCQDT